MIDATIPLTVAEWEEWGNPNEEKFFDYIKSYCPINNIKDGAVYPSCLITGGLHDPRVQASACFVVIKKFTPAMLVISVTHHLPCVFS